MTTSLAPHLPLSHAQCAITPVDAYLSQLTSAASRRTQRAALDAAARALGFRDAGSCPWELLTYADVVQLQAELTATRAPATAARYLGAVRSVIRCASALGLADPAEVTRIALVSGPTVPQHLSGRALTRTEFAALLTAAERHHIQTIAERDVATLSLLAATGARRAEVAALTHDDWDPAEKAIRIKVAKRDKARTVWLPPWATTAVETWLARLEGGPIIRRVTRTGAVLEGGISGAAVGDIVRRASASAGVPCTPHDLRRTLITELLADGVDPLAVAAVSGHARLESLRRYDRRATEAGRAATQRRKL